MDIVYQTSKFWFMADKVADAAQLLLPFTYLPIAFILLVRQRGAWSVLSAIGVSLAIGERLVRVIWLNKIAYVMMPAPQPMEGQDPLVLFLYLHGVKLGSLLFVIGILGCIWRSLPRRDGKGRDAQ